MTRKAQCKGEQKIGVPECTDEKEKVRHLNAVLNALREINRLIVKEKRPNFLIDRICSSLIRNRGYYKVWIILLDENGSVSAGAEAGNNEDSPDAMEKILKNQPTLCTRKILSGAEFLAVENPIVYCRGCPVAEMHEGQAAMSARLEHDGKIYGIITVSVPEFFSRDTEEQSLFKDLADDIAFALHSIEVEHKRRKTEAALRESRDKLELRVKERTNELEFLSSKLIHAQEEERKRIAADLHDGIGQCLSAVKFIVETALNHISPKVSETELNPLKALVPLLQEASEEVRNIVMNLRPSMLDDLGILATLGWFCRQFQTVYTNIQVEEKIDIREDQIPDCLKTILFRIFQEAMNNVAKHSNADRVELILRRRQERIELLIRDNGRGFDFSSLQSIQGPEKGFGIAGMKERAELSGGDFAIESRIHKGTSVRAGWTYTKIRTLS
jgi:signal transduction histidine kinase